MRVLSAFVSGVAVALLGPTFGLAATSESCEEDLSAFARRNAEALRFAVYVTAHQCLDNFVDRAGQREVVSVLRSLGVTRVFLESHRGGTTVPESTLVRARNCLVGAGFEVAGGIATTPGQGFGVRQQGQLGWLNFQNNKTRKDLEDVVRLTARVFDELIVDDFLCTADTSGESRRAKGQRSWSEYRRNLLVGVAENQIVKTAKSENPAATVIVKFPQWYDRFHLFGYDVPREAALFDGVWVGTETRGARTQRMGFVQPYEGFVNFRWISSIADGKVGGGWFDHIDCDANDFYDQCVETVLAGARQIILFNLDNLLQGHPGHHLLRRRFSQLTALAKMVRQSRPVGVYGYKPANSDAGGDLYIFDYLGMLGIPLLPTATYPVRADVVFVPTQATADADVEKRVLATLRNGGTVVATAGFLRKLPANARLLKSAGVQLLRGPEETLETRRLSVEGRNYDLAEPLRLEARLQTTSAQVLVEAEIGDALVPFLTVFSPPVGGKLAVLNSHTFSEADFQAVNEVLLAPRPVALLELPEAVLAAVRNVFLPTGHLRLVGPARVALHAFASGDVVVCNFNGEPVNVLLEGVPVQDAQLVGLETAKSWLRVAGGSVHLRLGARSHVWLKLE